MITAAQKEAFFLGFIHALAWSSVDDNDKPIDEGDYHWDPITRENLRRYCDIWCETHRADLNEYADIRRIDLGPDPVAYEHAGHDMALTANGDGTGFWDRDLGPLGDQLTSAAQTDVRTCGGCMGAMFDLYIGDDGLIYVSTFES